MKTRILYYLFILLALSSCHSNLKVNEEVGINSNFITQSRGVFDNDGYIATASGDGIYMIDKGKLKYVDIDTLNEVTIKSLNFSDDKEISNFTIIMSII